MTFFVISYTNLINNTTTKEQQPLHTFSIEEGEIIFIEYKDEQIPRAINLYFQRNVMNDKNQENLFIKRLHEKTDNFLLELQECSKLLYLERLEYIINLIIDERMSSKAMLMNF